MMLFVAFDGYNSIRANVLGLLSNAHRLGHPGLDYVVRRSTLSEAMPVAQLISFLKGSGLTFRNSLKTGLKGR